MTTNSASVHLPLDAPRLLEMLRQRRELYATLLQISREKLQPPGEDHELSKQWNITLRQRQILIDELAKLDRQLDPEHTGTSERWPKLDVQQVQQVGEMVIATRKLHDELWQLDQKLFTSLTEARNAIAQQLQHMNLASPARNAYSQLQQRPAVSRITNQQV